MDHPKEANYCTKCEKETDHFLLTGEKVWQNEREYSDGVKILKENFRIYSECSVCRNNRWDISSTMTTVKGIEKKLEHM